MVKISRSPTGSPPRLRTGSSSSQLYPSAGIKHEGSLLKLHYNLEESKEKRDRALEHAVRKYGYSETIRKLVALEVVQRGNSPSLSNRVHGDITVLQAKHRLAQKKGLRSKIQYRYS